MRARRSVAAFATRFDSTYVTPCRFGRSGRSRQDGPGRSGGPDRSRPSVRRLREAAAARVEASSLRQVAREIGMSPTGLRGFLDGAEPYTPTQRKLEQWYTTAGGGNVNPESARTALEVLLRGLPPAERPDALMELCDTLEEIYESTVESTPEWLREIHPAVD